MPVAEAGRLDGCTLEGPADLIHHKRRQGFSLYFFRDDQERTTLFRDFFQKRQQFIEGSNLLLMDQNQRILQHAFHPFLIGCKVSGQIAPVKTHSLDDLQFGRHGFGLFHRDDAVPTDFLDSLGEEISLATVTPSLVITGEPHFLDSITFRPLDPRVTLTVSARVFTPRKTTPRASSLKMSCLPARVILLPKFEKAI